MTNYELKELIMDYEIAARDEANAHHDYRQAQQKRAAAYTRLTNAIAQSTGDYASIATTNLAGDMVLYSLDEGRNLQTRVIGLVLTAGDGAK